MASSTAINCASSAGGAASGSGVTPASSSSALMASSGGASSAVAVLGCGLSGGRFGRRFGRRRRFLGGGFGFRILGGVRKDFQFFHASYV